jgi:hypothetical protein
MRSFIAQQQHRVLEKGKCAFFFPPNWKKVFIKKENSPPRTATRVLSLSAQQ